MTPHNRVLLVIGGAAVIVSLVTAAVYIETNAAHAGLKVDEASAHNVQTLGDDLLTEVIEQHEAIDDYLLSSDPDPLVRYRQAVRNEYRTAGLIAADSANLSGVGEALAGIAAENAAWRLTVADPAIAAVQSGSIEAIRAVIRTQLLEHGTSHAATRQFVQQIDEVEVELSARADALDSRRVTTAAFGLAIELLAAVLSLWFVRRYGLAVARDTRRRTNASTERMTIVASLRALRTQATLEGTAAVIAEALHRLPGVDVAGVFAFSADGLVALSVVGLPGFPIRTGDILPDGQARYLLERSSDGPWAERWIQPLDASPDEERRAELGIRSRAFAPILVDGEIIGLVGLATTDEDHARHLLEDLPAVGEFASVAETILAPTLIAHRDRADQRRRMAHTIDSAAFRPVFQPVVDLATGARVGFEALTRFNDDSRPDLMFAAALKCGMGIELEKVTLEAAVHEARFLPADTWLSLNVSPALLAQRGILGQVLGDRPGRVVLEVTEHEAIESYAPLREAMHELGPSVRLAVDDAGAGVANFSHLVELRPDFVKIDAGLVRGVDTDPSRRAVVVGLVHFAAEAGCEVIAEGIETEAERATVAELGVTLGQGYLLARPARAGAWSVASEIHDASAQEPPTRAGLPAPGRTPGQPGRHALIARPDLILGRPAAAPVVLPLN
jgi:EAL domain-containing protein (putative c-di-GMP-specific phosphodiesterase class I)/CHASE3 domain sensor protein